MSSYVPEFDVIRRLDVRPVQQLVISVHGEDYFKEQLRLHAPTVWHGLRVGQLVSTTLRGHGIDEDVCSEAGLAAALHDTGKFNEHILPHIKSSEVFDVPTRMFVTAGHAHGGYQHLIGKGLGLAAFVAGHHHDIKLPDDYHEFDEDSRWGITHLTMVYDVFDALLDPSREYVRKREGKVLSSEDIHKIVMARRGPHNPIIEGREINVPLMLGWSPDYVYSPN